MGAGFPAPVGRSPAPVAVHVVGHRGEVVEGGRLPQAPLHPRAAPSRNADPVSHNRSVPNLAIADSYQVELRGRSRGGGAEGLAAGGASSGRVRVVVAGVVDSRRRHEISIWRLTGVRNSLGRRSLKIFWVRAFQPLDQGECGCPQGDTIPPPVPISPGVLPRRAGLT